MAFEEAHKMIFAEMAKAGQLLNGDRLLIMLPDIQQYQL